MKENNNIDKTPEIIAEEIVETATKLKELIKESNNRLDIVFVIDHKKYHLEYNHSSKTNFDLEVSFPKFRFTTYDATNPNMMCHFL